MANVSLKIGEHLQSLEEELTRRFHDFKNVEADLSLISYPFSAEINTVPEDLQIELIDMHSDNQCQIDNSSKCSSYYGLHAFRSPRSSVTNFIYYSIYKIFFNLRSQYFVKFAVSSKGRFSIECCLCPEILV